jgi:signal transduction histidine kinase
MSAIALHWLSFHWTVCRIFTEFSVVCDGKLHNSFLLHFNCLKRRNVLEHNNGPAFIPLLWTWARIHFLPAWLHMWELSYKKLEQIEKDSVAFALNCYILLQQLNSAVWTECKSMENKTIISNEVSTYHVEVEVSKAVWHVYTLEFDSKNWKEHDRFI